MAGERDPIDFADLAAALLQRADTLVPQWLPGGKKQGYNWMCGGFEGGAGRSLGVNLNTGAWGEFAGDEKGGDLISLYAAIHNINNGQAARQLMDSLGWQRARPVQAPVPQRAADVGMLPEPPPDDSSHPGSKGKRKSVWTPVVPVPPNVPPCDYWHYHYKPADLVGSWEYRFEDQLYGHVARFATSDGGKEVLPYTWCVDESDDRGTMRWVSKQWDEPRPLYVPATVLSGDPSNIPVVLVEGEKCAMAGLKLLGGEFDFVSWPGGGNAWAKANWSWLMGRTVYLWADCDAKRKKLTKEERERGVDQLSKPLLPDALQPGVKAMVNIGSMLLADQACTVYWCPIPKAGNVSDGWDIADAIEQGWGAEEVRAFIRGATVFVAPDDAARAKAKGAESISTASRAGADPNEERVAWRSHMLYSGSGAIKAVRENLVLALDGVPSAGVPGVPEVSGVIAFNEFTNDVIKLKPPPWGGRAGVWEEEDELEMGSWLTREHWLPSMPRGTLEEAVLMVSKRHRYHPVRERLEGLRGTWDETKRLSTWVRRCCMAEDEFDDADPLQQYLARVGTWLLMAMCVRVLPEHKEGSRIVRGPGTKFDYMAIFEGPQGIGKSTLAAVLGGDYFADTGLMMGDKDSYQQLQGVHIYEMGELDAMSKSDITKVKLFISSTKDRFRASFDRRAKNYPRQVVFVGTTNEDHYLTDPTGNRRFWPVKVTRQVDIPWLRANLDQMLAEALVYIDAGDRFHPTLKEQRELFDPQQNQRVVENAIAAKIASYLHPIGNPTGANSDGLVINSISLVDLLGKIGIGVEKLGPGRFHEKQAAAALRALGWAEQRSSGPGRPRLYRRPDPSGSNESINSPTQGTQPKDDDDCPF